MGFVSDFVGDIFGGGGDPPPAPDPYATAQAQYGMNVDTARVNAALDRYKQITPYGTLDWSNVGDKWTQTQNLTPDGQFLLDAANKMSRQYSGVSDTLFNSASRKLGQDATPDPAYWKTLGQVPESNAGVRKSVEDALYKRATSRLDPKFAQARGSLETQLANQGITLGSEAYKTAQDNFGRSENDAYQSAIDSAIAGGGSEESRQLGLDLQSRNQGLSEHGQMTDEQYKARSQVLNELNALRTGSQVTPPQFTPENVSTSVAPTNLAQSVYNSYQGELGNYNAGVSSDNAMMGGLTNLGASYAGSAAGSAAITSGAKSLMAMF